MSGLRRTSFERREYFCYNPKGRQRRLAHEKAAPGVKLCMSARIQEPGLRRITRLQRPAKVRLFGFLVVVICGTLALSWMARSAWSQLESLQKEHAAVRSESFYLGVTLRGSIRALNDKLLQFGHSPDPVLRDDFLRESAELRRLLATDRGHLTELAKLPLLRQVLIDDFEILDRIDKEYDRYLSAAAKLLETTNAAGATALAFEDRYHEVRQASTPLVGLCDDLVKAQREDFADFLAETQSTLVSHQRLLKLTLTLIIALAGSLAVLVYRGMITPLRVSLDQSKKIIERQEKLASLGVLASGVAHEIRNPLTAIKMRLFSLSRSIPDVAKNEDASIIGSEISRLDRILKDFLRFARPSEPKLAGIPAEQVVEDVRKLMAPQCERKGIQLRVQTDEPAWVHADAQQLQQVLINLVQNAADSIGRNGNILLQVRRGEADFDGRTRQATILAVADTGRGIAPEIEARLFDPFFTTKETGTGLGLATAARIIEKHGGVLRYETEPGRGTTFEVVLPTIENYASQTTADRGRPEHRGSVAQSAGG